MKDLIAKYRDLLACALAAPLVAGCGPSKADAVKAALDEAMAAGPKPFAFHDPAHPKMGATGNNPAGWIIDPTTGALTAPSGKVIAGLSQKQAVDAVSTSNLASLTGLAVTVDTIALNTAGMRVFAPAQTTTTQDGCYVVASGAWTRCADFATGSSAAGTFFVAGKGTSNKGIWVVTNASGSDVVGTADLTATNLVTGGGGLTSPLTATLDFGGNPATNAADPTTQQGLVTRAYSDRKEVPVYAKTTAALPAYTANNGTLGVGATLTANANGAFPVLDTLVTLVANDPVKGLFLLQNGTSSADDGVWMLDVQGSGGTAWHATRYTGLDQAAEIPGSRVRVLAGLTSVNRVFTHVGTAAITMGTSPIFYLGGVDGAISVAFNEEFNEVNFTAASGNILPSGLSTNGTNGITVGVAADNVAGGPTIGAMKCTSGTTATCRCGAISSWGVTTNADSGLSYAPATDVGLYFESRFSVPVLSTSSNEFSITDGLVGTLNAGQVTPADGILFQYDRPTSTNLQLVTCSTSSGTCTKTVGPSISAATYCSTVMKKDAGTDLVRGWADCGAGMAEIGTGQSTNVPTGVLLGALLGWFRTVGTTSAIDFMHFDYFRGQFSIPKGRGN